MPQGSSSALAFLIQAGSACLQACDYVPPGSQWRLKKLRVWNEVSCCSLLFDKEYHFNTNRNVSCSVVDYVDIRVTIISLALPLQPFKGMLYKLMAPNVVNYCVFDGEATIHVSIPLKTFALTRLEMSGTEQLSLNEVAFLSVSTVASCGKKVLNLPLFFSLNPLFLSRQKDPKAFCGICLYNREKMSLLSPDMLYLLMDCSSRHIYV